MTWEPLEEILSAKRRAAYDGGYVGNYRDSYAWSDSAWSAARTAVAPESRVERDGWRWWALRDVSKTVARTKALKLAQVVASVLNRVEPEAESLFDPHFRDEDADFAAASAARRPDDERRSWGTRGYQDCYADGAPREDVPTEWRDEYLAATARLKRSVAGPQRQASREPVGRDFARVTRTVTCSSATAASRLSNVSGWTYGRPTRSSSAVLCSIRT
jgi:hypothetical protein